MAGLRTASTWVRISLVAIILAIILFVIGFATVAWVVAHHIRGHGSRQYDWSYWSIGLWEEFVCPLNKHRSCYEVVSNRNLKLWFHAGQAMECLGLIFMVIAFIILLLYICSNSFRRRSYLIGNVVCTFLSVTFIVIGLVIFITNFEGLYHDIGWSMGLAIAAAICAFISGIMSLLELCSR